jgi:hypothetical protein
VLIEGWGEEVLQKQGPGDDDGREVHNEEEEASTE